MPSVHLAVKGGARVIPVALTPFAREAGDSLLDRVSTELLSLLQVDLANTARFTVLVDSAGAGEGGWGPVLTRWAEAGAGALVRGETRYQPEGLSLLASLYRLPDGRLMIARTYPLDPGTLRKAAHRLSDDIVFALTGQRGVASTQIAFVSGRTGNKEIWRMSSDGLDAHQVTRDGGIAISPDWSPDGRRLVYSVLLKGRWDLYIVDVETGRKAPIRTSSALNIAPAWSPDGSRIAFSLIDRNNIDVFSVSSEGGGIRRLTDHGEADTEPCWSPDGRQMAFTSDRAGTPQIYLMSADGSGLKRLTWDPEAYEGSPAWSPDGRRIAFVGRGVEGFDVYVMELDGGTPFRLTSGGSNENPVWSPDGLQIAFSSDRSGEHDIYVMNRDGSNLRRLTTDGGNVLPAWSPAPTDP